MDSSPLGLEMFCHTAMPNKVEPVEQGVCREIQWWKQGCPAIITAFASNRENNPAFITGQELPAPSSFYLIGPCSASLLKKNQF